MLTEFLRDHAFTIAWFGLMAFVWLGWSQEAPPTWMRPILGLGSILGLGLAVWFGIQVARNWSEPSALEGRYHWFGVLVLAEVLAAGIGCLVLARRKKGRWMAWWVALVVALHFIPLSFLLADATINVLGVLQAAVLLGLVPVLRRGDRPTSRVAGPVMGFSLLAYAVVSAIVYLALR